jgi:hypothetical protein
MVCCVVRAITTQEGGFPGGHRLISALIFLNAVGAILCVVLIAAAVSTNELAHVTQVSEAVQLSLRLFVAGAALPTVAWGILAFEFDRSHSKKKLLESGIIYAVLFISLIFVLHCWMAPAASIHNRLANQLTIDCAEIIALHDCMGQFVRYVGR